MIEHDLCLDVIPAPLFSVLMNFEYLVLTLVKLKYWNLSRLTISLNLLALIQLVQNMIAQLKCFPPFSSLSKVTGLTSGSIQIIPWKSP